MGDSELRVYGISGLGADERVFDGVNRYMEHPITYVPWLVPEAKETLAHYAERMAAQINTSTPFALVGLSFGGMIATEMNKHLRPERTVIVSSCACAEELPIYFRGIGRLGLVPYIPNQLIQLPQALLDVVMSMKKTGSKELLSDIMQKTDRDFLKWAVQAILTWDNEQVPSNLKRIHGKADRLLPLKVQADDVLDGGHLIIMDEPEMVAKTIEKELA